jgi:hypothetical protein
LCDKASHSAYTASSSPLQGILVFTIRHCVVLLSVLCLSSTGTLAQDNIPSVLVTNKDEEAIAKHRLTVENVRKLFAVERELLKVMKDIPDLDTRAAALRMRIEPHRVARSLVVEAKVYEGIPEIAQILQRQNISGREYLLTQRVAMATEMLDEALRDEVLQREFEKSGIPMMTDALKFWRAMDPALKAEAAEWKKVREEMGKY